MAEPKDKTKEPPHKSFEGDFTIGLTDGEIRSFPLDELDEFTAARDREDAAFDKAMREGESDDRSAE